MKPEIQRIGDQLDIDGVLVDVEVEFENETDQIHGAYYENSNVREAEVDVVGRVISYLHLDPAQSEGIEEAVREYLTEEENGN